MKPIFRALLATSSLLCLHCGDADVAATAHFAGPSGMAVAGAAWDRVLVVNAGSDALQVVRLAPSLRDVDLMPGAARFHPLRLRAGARPGALAATADGRYVFVLDAIGGTLRVVDATALRAVPAGGGGDLALALGADSEAAAPPAGMVASRVACPAPDADTACLGRAYVSLSRLGRVAAVDLLATAAGLELRRTATIEVGGAPHALAAHPTRDAVFAADAEAPEVVRIDRGAGAAPDIVQRTPVGEVPGPLSVSEDGSLLLVGRPRARDLLVLTGAAWAAAGVALRPVDADPHFTPRPGCLALCGDGAAAACAGAHAADRALCAAADGLAATADAYGAVYLGVVPARLAALATPSHPVVAAGAGGEVAYSEAVAVAGLEGSVFTVGLRRATDGLLMPALLARGSDVEPTVRVATSGRADAAAPPGSLLAPCQAGPERARLSCAGGSLQLLRGQLAEGSWTFRWEAPLVERPEGGGSVDAAGQLVDASGMLTQADIVAGDILELLGPAALDPACGARERRIVGVTRAGATTTLPLQPPLAAACAAAGGQLRYRVRAGGCFVVRGGSDGAATTFRLRPGEAYGLGHARGVGEAVAFRLQPMAEAHVAGSLYDAERGRVLPEALAAGHDPRLSREGAWTLTVTDPYSPLRRGLAADALGRPAGTLGALPGGMVRSPATATLAPRLLVSYAGSNTVLVADPTRADAVAHNDVDNRVLGGSAR